MGALRREGGRGGGRGGGREGGKEGGMYMYNYVYRQEREREERGNVTLWKSSPAFTATHLLWPRSRRV